jgi:hypothetical protein
MLRVTKLNTPGIPDAIWRAKLPIAIRVSTPHIEKVAKPGNSGMVAKFLSWLRRTLTDLSEKAVDDALDSDATTSIDFEILGDPRHPKFHEMRRRHNERQAREDRDDID